MSDLLQGAEWPERVGPIPQAYSNNEQSIEAAASEPVLIQRQLTNDDHALQTSVFGPMRGYRTIG
jgi:hypothetical protein